MLQRLLHRGRQAEPFFTGQPYGAPSRRCHRPVRAFAVAPRRSQRLGISADLRVGLSRDDGVGGLVLTVEPGRISMASLPASVHVLLRPGFLGLLNRGGRTATFFPHALSGVIAEPTGLAHNEPAEK